jgi:class 3 adenylate cyclase
LTAEDLKDLGVTIVGHRRVLLDAIGELRSGENAEPKLPTASATAAEPARDKAAERRQVTVMFSDLVGSTALSTRMDPEDLREVISVYQKCVADTVQRLGGFVGEYMGDGVLLQTCFQRARKSRSFPVTPSKIGFTSSD